MKTTTLPMEDMLGGLGDEHEQESRETSIEHTPGLDKIIESFEAYLSFCKNNPEDDKIFGDSKKFIPKFSSGNPLKHIWNWIFPEIPYSAKDIEHFSLSLGQYASRKEFYYAGEYLSALINASNEQDITIHSEGLIQPLHYFGYKNEKNICVYGDLGDSCGLQMKKGSLIVHGDVGSHCGESIEGGTLQVMGSAGIMCGSQMDGGTVIVEKNVSHLAGSAMNNGTLIINGNAEHELGGLMRGGTIHLKGTYGGQSQSMTGGDIYHKGKLIVKDGKKV